MTTEEQIAFGPVLSRYRIASGLTQEQMAERAGLSVRGISDLERGVNKNPRAHTVRLLVDALQLSPDDRLMFEHAARVSVLTPRVADAAIEGNFLGALPIGQLVGCEEELRRIQTILDAVTDGAGQFLLLSGETGVGKTRLLQQVMVGARGRGAVIATGRCYEAQQAVPYYPFLEALASLATAAPENVRADYQRSWKRVQDLMDSSEADNGVPQRGAAAQQQLSTLVSDLLGLVACSGPVALLIDDLQWADSASLQLLQHLARRGRASKILIAASFRDSVLTQDRPDLAQMIQTLSRERIAERLSVRRLSLEETTKLVAITMGQDEASDEFASFVYRRTKGNPRLIDQLVRSLGGRLELAGEIGAGSMGRVFRAFDRTTERTVAAKLVLARDEIDLDALMRFQQEGAVLAQLTHPNIVDIYDTFAEEHASCIIMELLEGQSLGVILQDGPIPLDRAKCLATQVAEALAYAHSQGIVHRDIKPDNVMVLDRDQVKVTDFGIARILRPDTSLQTIATTGMRMGTPVYMAPEQIAGKKIDGRTDIYALGAMLYHLVTGKQPFEGNDALTIAVKHLQDEPLPPSQVNSSVPRAWDALILKAMAKEPKSRYQSASEMERTIAALPVEPATVLESRGIRDISRWVLAAAMAALVAIAAMVLTFTLSRAQPSGSRSRSTPGSKLDSYLTYLTSQGKMSGTVLVARRGQIILSKGYGLADRAHHVANDPTVKYPSIANFNINLTAALKLEEEGRLHGSDRICSYLPNCPWSWRQITVHQVVDGTSGLPDITWDALPGTTAQSLSTCETYTPIQAPPGTANYQNCNTLALGTIFQKITGQPWETVIRNTVLNSAGMQHTARMTDALKPPARADDYNGTVSGARNFYNPYFELYSTTADVLRFDDALFGGKLLSPANLRTLLTPRDLQPDPGVPDARMAYMWKVGHLAGQPVIYRYGTTDLNFTGINMRFPRDGTSIIVNSNVQQDNALPLGVNLAKLLYGRTVIFPLPQGHIASAPADRAIQATINVQTGVGLATFVYHAIWLPNDNVNTVTRVSTRTDRITGITPLSQVLAGSSGDSLSVTGSGGQLWAIHNGAHEVVRLDPITGNVLERVSVDGYLDDISYADGIVWATSRDSDNLVRIDPSTRMVTHIGHKFGFPTELAVGTDSVWVSDWKSATVRRIDTRTRKVVAVIPVGTDPESIAVAYGSVWVVNGTGGYISRIDPATNQVVAQIALGTDEQDPNGGPCCHGLAVGEGALWVAVHRDHKVVRIDPSTNRATSELVLPIPPADTTIDVWDVMVGDGSVWVHAEPHLLFRIDPKVMAAA